MKFLQTESGKEIAVDRIHSMEPVRRKADRATMYRIVTDDGVVFAYTDAIYGCVDLVPVNERVNIIELAVDEAPVDRGRATHVAVNTLTTSQPVRYVSPACPVEEQALADARFEPEWSEASELRQFVYFRHSDLTFVDGNEATKDFAQVREQFNVRHAGRVRRETAYWEKQGEKA